MWIPYCAAILCSFAVVMQFGMSGIVFHNDFQCRKLFDSSNVTAINQQMCETSLIYPERQCYCVETMLMSYINGYNYFRVFDEGSVAMASLLFIALTINEVCKILPLLDNQHVTFYEIFSVFGLISLILNPFLQAHVELFRDKLLIRGSMLHVFIDAFAIGLVAQYPIKNTGFALITTIASVCDIIVRLVELYLANRRDFNLKYPPLKSVSPLKTTLVSPPDYV